MRPGGFSPRSDRLPPAAAAEIVNASMRPGGFSPRSGCRPRPTSAAASRFNEAGGILPPEWRKRRPRPRPAGCFNEAGGILPPEWSDFGRDTDTSRRVGFNEAGGILPPECQLLVRIHAPRIVASMRPGGFSPRSGRGRLRQCEDLGHASMRPGGFSPRSAPRGLVRSRCIPALQ